VEPSALDVALVVGFAGRLTRLAVDDSIAEPFRNATRWLGRRLHGEIGLVWADDLVTCPWCVGAWLSLAVVVSFAAWGAPPAGRVVAAVLGVSYAVGRLAPLEPEE
jgi:hypothetical protein